MNIPETEVIKLKDSQAAFAIGLDCENKTAQDPYEIFNLEIKYVLYTKDMDGKYDKKKTPLATHLCTYNDFYNNYDTSFDYLGMKNYLCLDNNDHKIEGIYSNQLFSYYEFSLTSKGHTSYAEKYLKGGANRVHGGGFAGTILNIVKNDDKDFFIENVSKFFGRENIIPLKVRKFGTIVL